MGTFNRIRERDTGTEVVTQKLEYNQGYPVSNGPYTPYDITNGRLECSEVIWDNVPVGKYRPGQFKITEVARKKITTAASAFDTGIYYSLNNPPTMRVSGRYLWPIITSASGMIPVVSASNEEINDLGVLALAKAKAPYVGVGETLAETDASLRMLKKPLSGMASILGKVLFKKGKARALRTLKDASSAWLEAVYGWIPLYDTARQLIKGLDKYRDGDLFDSHAVGKTSSVQTFEPAWLPFVYGHASQALVECTIQDEVRKRFQVYFHIVDSMMFESTRAGVGIWSTPGLAWELVPLSFVLDWWLNVGDWIYALTPNPSITTLGCTFSTKRTVTTVNYVRAVRNANSLCTTGCFATYAVKQESYCRDLVLPPGISPSWDFDFSSIKHAISGLSLIIQRIPARVFANRR